jgi:hypothetical protein
MSAIELLLVLLFAVPATRSAQQVSEADLASRRRPPNCSQSVGKKGESEELDVSVILWRTHSNTEDTLGNQLRLAPPRTPLRPCVGVGEDVSRRQQEAEFSEQRGKFFKALKPR